MSRPTKSEWVAAIRVKFGLVNRQLQEPDPFWAGYIAALDDVEGATFAPELTPDDPTT